MKSIAPLNNRLRLCQGVRRVIVGVMYGAALLVLVYWTSLLANDSAQRLATAHQLSIIGSIIFYLCFLALYLATGRLAEEFGGPFSGGRADERQRALRNRAYLWAYLIFGFAIGSLWFWPLPDTLGVFWKVFAFFSLYGTLPTAVIAWLEPDPVPDEPIERPLRQREA